MSRARAKTNVYFQILTRKTDALKCFDFNLFKTEHQFELSRELGERR